MGQLASDNFNRADAGTLGANWTTITGFTSLRVTSNQATTDGDPQGNRYNAVTWPANQYSQVTLKSFISVGAGKGFGVVARAATGAETAYLAFGNTSGLELYKVVATVFTQLGTSATVPVVNDLLYIEAKGTAIKVFLNGVQKISVTDSAIASGNAGLFAGDDGLHPAGDDWSGGNFGNLFSGSGKMDGLGSPGPFFKSGLGG